MCAADQVEIVLLGELADDSFTEGVANTSVVFAVFVYPFLWVRPQEIAKQAGVRNVSRSHNIPDLL